MNQLRPGSSDNRPSPARMTVWIAVAGMGIFLLVSGIVGIIAKG